MDGCLSGTMKDEELDPAVIAQVALSQLLR